jgi:cell division septum initiation protein DivIVA
MSKKKTIKFVLSPTGMFNLAYSPGDELTESAVFPVEKLTEIVDAGYAQWVVDGEVVEKADKKAKAEAETLLNNAKAEAENIINQAKAEAEQILANAKEKASAELKAAPKAETATDKGAAAAEKS